MYIEDLAEYARVLLTIVPGNKFALPYFSLILLLH